MIPYLDLKSQYRTIKNEVDQAVLSVLENGQYVLGGEVADFEKEFASYCGVKFAVGVNTGTSALHLALLTAGIGPGDEVITTPLTFVATVAAILYAGAKPVFVDIDPATLNLDVRRIPSVITKKTKALLPVHLYGQPVDMKPLLDLASKNNLILIEDAAQAHGAEYQGKRVGGIGHLGCFSFYPGKNLGAYGEGGAVTTNDPQFAQKIRILRDWGAEKRYHHDLKGFNFRMETLQGAVLRIKLRHLEKWTEARRVLAERYNEGLKESSLEIPAVIPGSRHVYHVYPVLFEERDALQAYLETQGIHTNIHYPIPVHLQKAYAELGYKEGDFPIAESACRRLLSLPLYPELSASQADEVIRSVKQGVKEIRS